MDRRLSGPQLARMLAIPPDARPYYRVLAEAVRQAILDGRIALDIRLPAERHLAHALDVSRTTVTAAYDRLREQGYVLSRQGSGSRTALPAPGALGGENPWIIEEDGLLPLHVAAPPAPSAMDGAVEAAARAYPRHALGMGYRTMGLENLREAIAGRYTHRGLPTRPEQILVTTGAQHAFFLLINLLIAWGDPIMIESPTYPHAIDAARGMGARILPVGVGDDGWDLDLVIPALRSAALAYVIPDFHNPTGHLMDADTRRMLAEAARRSDTCLVADESWAELALDDVEMPPPLAAFDSGNHVITIGSASKLWWGGLRIGWIRATAALVRRLSAARKAVEIASPVFDQLVVAELFPSIEETRSERRATLSAGRAALAGALAEHLPEWRFRVPPGGGSLWVRLDEPVSTALSDAAAAHGVRLAPGPWFGVEGTLERYLRMPYTQPPSVLTEGVRRIAAARRGGPYGVRAPESLTPAL